MQNAIRITNGGTGRIDHQAATSRTSDGVRWAGKKEDCRHRERNAFLTSRFIPIAEDYLVEDEMGGACINLTTSENFDYLYRSALRYADLMNVRLLPREERERSRINITALLTKALDETLPEHVNLEERAGRLHFCLYRFHDWPDHTLVLATRRFHGELPVPLRRIVREFIRQFVRYHGLNASRKHGIMSWRWRNWMTGRTAIPRLPLRQSVNTNAWRNPINPGKSQKHLNEWKGNRSVPIWKKRFGNTGRQ